MKKKRGRGGAGGTTPVLDDRLKKLFREIGKPEPRPFKPDPFQLEALELINDFDVLVSAATGSGKTWIASQAIHSYLSRGLRAWYASPLKALSNSIYDQFCNEFGAGNCGILTGDRKENTEAPVIVGTTEILRNQLYDSMHEGTDVGTDLVILDEAHYLSDPFRGVVWEEVLIYLPARIRILLLSATISNADELCEWMRDIRNKPNRVVRSEKRPVPLETIFLFPDGLMVHLEGKDGINPRIKRFIVSGRGRKRRRTGRVDFEKIISLLRQFDLLPAIFFLKSRADCDKAVLKCPAVGMNYEEKRRMEQTVKNFIDEYPHLAGRNQLKPLLGSRVGSHHGGQLPYWKVLIERMMSEGFLEAIFSTSTVAAGVNFPARTVVLVQSDRYNGKEFIDLTATDLHQMIGRAGRRGKDKIGFAMVVPGPHQDAGLIQELKDSKPEPLLSQIHINFSMTLNLLLSHSPYDVQELLKRSFAAFQEKKKGHGLKRQWEHKLKELQNIIPEGKCDTSDPFVVYENIQKTRELKGDLKRIRSDERYERRASALGEYLKAGRLFLHKNGNIYVITNCSYEKDKIVCSSIKAGRTVNAKIKGNKVEKVRLSQIRDLYDYEVNIPDGASRKGIMRYLESIPVKELVKIPISIPAGDLPSGRMESVRKKIDLMPCRECVSIKTCHGSGKGGFNRLLKDLVFLSTRIEGMGEGLWLSFKRHVRFLKETGFVDEEDRLTGDGRWAAKLRLDQPLLIAEAIRKGAFSGVSAEYLAAGLAPFVWDRTQDVELDVRRLPNFSDLEPFFALSTKSIEEIRSLKKRRGFENPAIAFWPAAALFLWARGTDWEQLIELFPVSEGDLASLITRTADHLNQVTNLQETHGELASSAKAAVGLILREPVHIF